MFDEIKADIVASANALRTVLTDGKHLQETLAASDVAFGVFPDPTEADGVGLLLLKGQARLREVIGNDRNEPLRIIGIPCREIEEAEAIRLTLGENDGRH